MNQQSLAQALIGSRWYNPFPKFKFSERPDTAAACIMEGKVAILVDNSPAAMILPTSILDMIEEANDYYFPAWTALYLKMTRIMILLLTVFLTPVFLLLMLNPEWIPPAFEFAGLVLGEFSVKSGWFNSEVMLYMAFVAIANYTQPNFELGYAVKFMRIILLILTATFNWIGFLAGCILLLVLLCTNKTLSGRNYLNVKLN